MFGFSFYFAKAKTAVLPCIMNLSLVHPAWQLTLEPRGGEWEGAAPRALEPRCSLGQNWGQGGSTWRHPRALQTPRRRRQGGSPLGESIGRSGVRSVLERTEDSSRIRFPGMNCSFSPAGDATWWPSPLVIMSPTPLVPNGPDSPGQPLFPSEAPEPAPARNSTPYTGTRKNRLSLRTMLIKSSEGGKVYSAAHLKAHKPWPGPHSYFTAGDLPISV